MIEKKCGKFELAETTARYRKDLIEMSRAFHVCLDVLNDKKTKMFQLSRCAVPNGETSPTSSESPLLKKLLVIFRSCTDAILISNFLMRSIIA